jgi:glycosyltransferase involved in cell wall biosynthesis
MTQVSVVIPTFNRWPMLGEAVASVIAQCCIDFELIIVDDGSTDETAARLSHLAEQCAVAQIPFRILRSRNHGPAAARNRGVSLARSSLIAFLDSDDLWNPYKLKRQVDQMRRRPGCRVLQTEEIWLLRGIRVNPGLRHRKRDGDFFLDSLRTCLVSPSAVMMHTRVFVELGGFDEDMRAAEDYDLWLRLLLEHPVELLREPLVIRRAGHPGQLSAAVPAIDRFRILALLKLLQRSDLNGHRREAVCDVLIEKCRIYGKGAVRRGNTRTAEWVAGLAEMANSVWRRSADRTLENAIDVTRTNLARQQLSTSNLQDKLDAVHED